MGAAFLPEPLLPRRPNPAPSGATAQPVASPFRIRGEKSPNINQKRQQFRGKLKIARKRRDASHVRRAGRNSPLKPPFRPARFLVGVFGDLGHQGEGCPRRKNEGAVADQRLLTALRRSFHRKGNHITRSGPLPLPQSLWRALGFRPVWPLRFRRAPACGRSATGVAFPYRSSPGADRSPCGEAEVDRFSAGHIADANDKIGTTVWIATD